MFDQCHILSSAFLDKQKAWHESMSPVNPRVSHDGQL